MFPIVALFKHPIIILSYFLCSGISFLLIGCIGQIITSVVKKSNINAAIGWLIVVLSAIQLTYTLAFAFIYTNKLSIAYMIFGLIYLLISFVMLIINFKRIYRINTPEDQINNEDMKYKFGALFGMQLLNFFSYVVYLPFQAIALLYDIFFG